MNIPIRPYTEESIPHVQAFNRRMIAGGLQPLLAFPESPDLEFPMREDALIWQQGFLAVEDDLVRGAYYFTHERYTVAGAVVWIAHYRHPISEVVINKAYKGLSSALMADALNRQPLLYCLGMGGTHSPVLRRLRVESWVDAPVPFWFHVVRPAVFLRNMAVLRKTSLRCLVFDMAATTGLGWLSIHVLQSARALGGPSCREYSWKIVPEFGDWADELWEMNQAVHLLAAVRDRVTLNLRYAPSHPRFRRIQVLSPNGVAGWAVVLDKRMQGNRYFGDMHVGTIVDCLAAPGHEIAVVRAAAAASQAAGADILVTNQSAAAWCKALRRTGFLPGPSNYILALSPELARRVHPLAANMGLLHVNRGDGAGTSRL